MIRILVWLLMVTCVFGNIAYARDDRVLLSVDNPSPANLPTLGVWEEYSSNQDRYYRYVSAKFPNVLGFTCDLWCFESAGIVYESSSGSENGGITMRHTWEGKPWVIVTQVTPLKGALDLVSRLEPTDPRQKEAPDEYPELNVCWQLKRAVGFESKPDPYPEFVRRCFIYTEKGRTFLLETERRPIPVRPRSHKRNNPPWVQMYLPKSAPADIKAEPTSWAAYSPDRYTLPIIGAISRDGKYLTALATASEGAMSQAWHDCMHNNAKWLPSSDGLSREWRIRVYVIENDPQALADRFKHDFPKVHSWQ